MSTPSDEQLDAWGASLREIDPATLQQDAEEGPVRWFQGEAGCEVTVWLGPQGEARHVQLVFSRVSVDWSREDGLRTGSFLLGAAAAGGRYDGYLIGNARAGGRLDREVVAAARRLLVASRAGQELLAPLRQALDEALGP